MSTENYDLSRQIDSDLIEKIEASKAGTVVTDCPTCRMQIEAFGGKPMMHPMEVLAERLPSRSTIVAGQNRVDDQQRNHRV